jgi:DNA-binding transcriptional LysR family regulator
MLASSAALRDARRRVSHLVSDLEHQLDVRVLERITPRCQPPA